MAKSSTTGASLPRGIPTQNGAVEKRRSSEAKGATITEPEAVTKWIETRPAAAARSAHSPTRPRWPELRKAIAARPVAFAFFDAYIDRERRHRVAEAEIAVDDGEGGRVDDAGQNLVGRQLAFERPVDIQRNADDAVAVVASQIGADERGGDAARLLLAAADAGEDFATVIDHRGGGDAQRQGGLRVFVAGRGGLRAASPCLIASPLRFRRFSP